MPKLQRIATCMNGFDLYSKPQQLHTEITQQSPSRRIEKILERS